MNKWVIAAGIVLGVILLFGTVIFIVLRLFNTGSDIVVVPSPTTTPVATTPGIQSPIPTTQPRQPTPTLTPSTPIQSEVYNGPIFSLSYPSDWGLLTCSNSPNIEFDPDNNVDQTAVVCGYALKPITIVISDNLLECVGTQTTIGNVSVIKGVLTTESYTQYQWCTQTSPVLNITHRVGPTPSRAVSTTNYSTVIESIITTLQLSAGRVTTTNN